MSAQKTKSALTPLPHLGSIVAFRGAGSEGEAARRICREIHTGRVDGMQISVGFDAADDWLPSEDVVTANVCAHCGGHHELVRGWAAFCPFCGNRLPERTRTTVDFGDHIISGICALSPQQARQAIVEAEEVLCEHEGG